MRAAQADYGYTIEQASDGYAISYRHKKRSLWAFLTFVIFATMALVVPLFLVLDHTVARMMTVTNGTVVLWALALAAAISILVAYGYRASRPKSSIIAVSPHYLNADGKRYERQHIRELFAKAPYREEFRGPVFQNSHKNLDFIALGGSGALGGRGIAAAGLVGAHQAAEDAGRVLTYGLAGGFNAWNRTRGWSIWINHGAKTPSRIAHRIDEADVQSLLNDLGSLLGS